MAGKSRIIGSSDGSSNILLDDIFLAIEGYPILAASWYADHVAGTAASQ